ncbi:TetR family transcriptional regulator [Curtobacterium sp. MCBD17_034]|uniref:TetR/AcrR family transcriptional regulator n=1 Tax=unclassified Curtobacterium TaxID=257496 RepID=UPI000DA8E52F|nr:MULTISPECIES: TetR/AcrR family transcriptional regulator [unclassified Curtobacterium]PZF62336.1 TetR family transcriptional regulator [Curtobacterium sp. MCBD17_034]PZM39957.1 TetR family transcriptional regulator [Curtobacterium sp. MCBD17_031]
MPRTTARGGPETRARIAAIASGLFHERGFDAVTVAEVARAAGVSSVTVFNHFPRKEDLFLDRSLDAAELLRAAVRSRPAGTDVLAALHAVALRLVDERHPLSGLDDRSGPFFRTVAESSALVARAREIGAELQRTLEDAVREDGSSDGDPTLLAALVVAGYATVLVVTARHVISGTSADALVDDHRARLGQLFDALRHGLAR